MPQVLGLIGAQVVGFLGVAISTTSTLALIVGAGTLLLGNAALRALSPKSSVGKATGYTLTQRGSALNHQVVYGKTRVAGAEVFKASSGSDNTYLHFVIAFTGHEIESFDEIWINDQKATIDGNGNVSTVTSEDGTTSNRYSGKMIIQQRLGGSDNQTAVNFGSSPNRPVDVGWTANHKLTNIAFLYVRLKFDRSAFPNGVPEIQATIKGKKVYDPRTGLTTWSDNPALCVRDYLTNRVYGLGESYGKVDDVLFSHAANACDETSIYTDTKNIWGENVVLGQKKYTLNGSFTTAESPADILEDMLTSMGGSLWYSQGKWRNKAAKWTAPVLTLSEDDLRSSITLNTRHSTRDNFNCVKGTFRGVETNYVETDYEQYPLDDSTNPFIAADDEQKNVVDLGLPFTSDHITARRLARIALEKHRQQLQFSATFGMKAFQLQVGDVVRIDNKRFGWVGKEFEVLSWSFSVNQDLGLEVQMSLQETSQSVFDEVDDGAVYERDNTTLFSPFDVPSVSIQAPSSGSTLNRDGTVLTYIDLYWQATDPDRVSTYLVEWSNDGGLNYTSVTTEGTSYRVSPVQSGTSYLVRVTPSNYLGVVGETVVYGVSTPVANDNTTPNPPTIVSVSGGYRTATVDWDEPTQNTDGSSLTDLRYYRVYRGTTSNPTTEIGVTYSSIFTDGGLDDNTTYYYRIKAVDTSGNESAYSSQISVTTNPELVDGADGASILVVYADDASGSNQSLSSVGKGYVQYVEYTGSTPTLPVSGNFVRFVGADGQDGTNGTDGADGQDGADGDVGRSIWPIYAETVWGDGQTFNATLKRYVTFYESTTQPTLPVSGQIWVRYVGADGADGQDGTNGTDGVDGERGAGRRDVGVTTLPTTSSGAAADYFAAYGNDLVDRDQAWFYTGTLSNPTGQSVWIYNAVTDTWNEQEEVIDGDLLVTGSITTDKIAANQITAELIDTTDTFTMNLSVGDLAVAADATPTSGSGAVIKSTGDFTVGNGTEFVSFDSSTGLLTIQGVIRNISEQRLLGQEPMLYNAVTTSTPNLSSVLNGAGVYSFVLVGGGGGGALRDEDYGGASASGGSGSGCCIFSFYWDGSTVLGFTRGNGGAGASSQFSDPSTGNGSSGTSSVFSYNSLTLATAFGGLGGAVDSTTRSGGSATIQSISGLTLLSSVTRTGGSAIVGSAGGGGGVDYFGTGADSGSGGRAKAGGSPFGTFYNNTTTMPQFGTDKNLSFLNNPNYLFGKSLDTIHLFKGGRPAADNSTNALTFSTDMNGGIFGGGGGAYYNDLSSIRGGDGGFGGGGGALRRDRGSNRAGNGGNGILLWSKL